MASPLFNWFLSSSPMENHSRNILINKVNRAGEEQQEIREKLNEKELEIVHSDTFAYCNCKKEKNA